MKKNILFICIILLYVSMFFSCKKNENILFCTGIPNDKEKKAECGKIFYSGELTVVIKNTTVSGVKTITVIVYELRDAKKIIAETLTVEVDPQKNEYFVNVALLNKGTYLINALADKKVFAEGTVTIYE